MILMPLYFQEIYQSGEELGDELSEKQSLLSHLAFFYQATNGRDHQPQLLVWAQRIVYRKQGNQYALI